jgi:hypothetical protein
MKRLLRALFTALLGIFLTACASKSVDLKAAPQNGVPVVGLNVLFNIGPMVSTKSTGAAATSTDLMKAKVNAERLRDELKQRLVPKLRDAQIGVNFDWNNLAAPGLRKLPSTFLFPADSLDTYHLLVITLVRQSEFCYQGSCATTFTLSLSLRDPKNSIEIWSAGVRQGELSAADWVPGRNDRFIDDLGQSILKVAIPQHRR